MHEGWWQKNITTYLWRHLRSLSCLIFLFFHFFSSLLTQSDSFKNRIFPVFFFFCSFLPPQSGWYLTLNVSPTVTTQGGPDWTFSLCVCVCRRPGLNFKPPEHTEDSGNGGVSSRTAALYAPQTPRGIHGGEPRALVTTGAAFKSRRFHVSPHFSPCECGLQPRKQDSTFDRVRLKKKKKKI